MNTHHWLSLKSSLFFQNRKGPRGEREENTMLETTVLYSFLPELNPRRLASHVSGAEWSIPSGAI